MKAALYGTQSHAGWEWTCTLDSNVDRFYRFERYAADTGVIWFEPSLSMGQAVWARDRLNRTCVKEVTLDKARRELIKGLSELSSDLPLQDLADRMRGHLCRAADWKPEEGFEPMHEHEIERFSTMMEGRSLLPEEVFSLLTASGLAGWKDRWIVLAQTAMQRGRVNITNGMTAAARKFLWKREMVWRCRRCGSGAESLRMAACPHCGGDCPYCEACLTMGRVRFCSVMLEGKQASGRSLTGRAGGEPADGDLQKWRLSPAQEDASLAGLRFLERTLPVEPVANAAVAVGVPRAVIPPRFLIWAVTGAGKTEMIFPIVEHELLLGHKVLLATPRRDVVMELLPRLAQAFPVRKIVALYGGSEQRWEQGDVTLATTHQLLRLWRCFDLVIIDELDAFPYHNNPMLQYAVHKVCKETGRYILLSATPPEAMQREAAAGKLPHAMVPVRYHRHPLPVPRRLAVGDPELMLRSGRVAAVLERELRRSLERGAQVFFFVPRIGLVEPFVQLLSHTFPGRTVEGTSSKDAERSGKVTGFREKASHILVTTTILERGVTVPMTDVFIIGADAALFDQASLVQMSGRAGRSKADPAGRVFFASREWTRSQVSAIKQIQGMNTLARKKGYLLESKPGGSEHG